MRQQKNDLPAVVEFPDHEVITPQNKLIKAVSKLSLPDDDPVARAEAALARLSSEFSKWMGEECERLDVARLAVHESGIDKKTLGDLFRAAHDIKGHAGTYGFPLVAPVAESLCRVLDRAPEPERIPLELIDRHVEGIRAVVRENARPDIEDLATVLMRKLRTVSDEYLAAETAGHRPEGGDEIAPPLAPEGS